jgi:hypothetical protein
MRAGRQSCEANRPGGENTMTGTRYRGIRPIQLMGLLAIAAVALAWQ